MILTQVAIAVFGVSAVFLSQDPRERVRRWACVCGLLSQPAWFYETYSNEQWGIFALCFLYAFSWARGFYYHWVKGWLYPAFDRTKA
jgi:hypothetical protein